MLVLWKIQIEVYRHNLVTSNKYIYIREKLKKKLMSTFKNTIIFIIFLIIACFIELIVIDEEVLLLLCFVAFFFNSFINFGSQVQNSLESRSKSIKSQYLYNLEFKSEKILESIEQIENYKKKAILWNITETFLKKKLKTGNYIETIKLFPKSHIYYFQVIDQRYIARKNFRKSTILNALPFSIIN